MATISPESIKAEIAKGRFKPHTALSNMAISYFQEDKASFAKSIFPICQVAQSSDLYYIFRKEDLLRDNWERKPEYGKVNPAVLSEETGVYNVSVDQMIMGISQIRQTDLIRRQGPSIKDPRQQRTQTIAHNANIHQDRLFAKNFFKTGVWTQEYEGVDSSPSTGQFLKFSNNNSDPVEFIDQMATDMEEKTGRRPNRMALGVDVYNALKVHPGIIDRVKYGGTTANPATVTENVLAQLFDMERIVVQRSTNNKAKFGATASMEFIGDPKAFLLAYATDAPSVDEPSAGYIFTWDMLGDGNYLPILNYEGENGVHAEFVEGLMATDMRKTADDLGMFFKTAVD